MVEVAPAAGRDASAHQAGFLKSILSAMRKRPYLLLLILVFTPPFWTLLFFFLPVIIAGVVLAAGFVVLDQANQKQGGGGGESQASSTQGSAEGEMQTQASSTQGSTVGEKGTQSTSTQRSNGQNDLPNSVKDLDHNPAPVTVDEKATPTTTTTQSAPQSLNQTLQTPVPSQTSQLIQSATDPNSQAAPLLGPKPAEAKGSGGESVPTPMTGPAMLAKAAALRKSKLEAASKSLGEILFLYGSQTGNAMEVAKSLNAEAVTHGITSRVLALDEKPLHKIPGTTKAAVFVVSSTGDGDPPENCERFFNALKRKTHAPDLLSGVRFTVLGLGDSNYTTYMGVPRVFTSRLPELGAKKFYKNCEADEVDGLEDVIDAWKEGLWSALKVVAAEASTTPPAPAPSANGVTKPPEASSETELVGVPPLQQSRIKLIWHSAKPPVNSPQSNGAVGTEYNAAHPLSAPVTAAEYMTASWSDRRVIHLEVVVSQSGSLYSPGDSLGVLPENRPELVDALLKRLGAEGEKVFSVTGIDGDVSANVSGGGVNLLGHVGWPCTLREALLRHCDLTAVARKGLLRVLSEYCSNVSERTELLMLSSRGGKDAYRVQIQEGRPSLLEILQRFPSCKPDLAHLLDSLPPLVARMYSVTCDSESVPGKAQVAFSVVREEGENGRVFHGVCTSWLERRLGLDPKARREYHPEPSKPVSLPVFLKSGGDFRLPGSLEAPLLLIGPGTGVAPFRGFLQKRRQLIKAGREKAGPAWLFFGCRKEDEDFLYKEDFRQFETDGTLTKLVTAFSREGPSKIYVQHKLQEHGQEIARLIQHEKAHVFICGDGVNMARDVQAALVKLLIEVARMSEAEATAFLAVMAKEKRYVKDIWS